MGVRTMGDVIWGNMLPDLFPRNGRELVGCVAQYVGRTPVFGGEPCSALGLQPTGDHYVGKPSATSQPTRPTQPFILPGSIHAY